jgi:hypothetical protein
MAECLESRLDPHVETLFLSLSKMLGLSKKLTHTAAFQALSTLVAKTSFQFRLMNLIHVLLKEKNATQKHYAAQILNQVFEKIVDSEAGRYAFEKHNCHETLVACLKRGLSDGSAPVREEMRNLYFRYQDEWPNKAESLYNDLDGSVQKTLQQVRPTSSHSKVPSPKERSPVLAPKKEEILSPKKEAVYPKKDSTPKKDANMFTPKKESSTPKRETPIMKINPPINNSKEASPLKKTPLKPEHHDSMETLFDEPDRNNIRDIILTGLDSNDIIEGLDSGLFVKALDMNVVQLDELLPVLLSVDRLSFDRIKDFLLSQPIDSLLDSIKEVLDYRFPKNKNESTMDQNLLELFEWTMESDAVADYFANETQYCAFLLNLLPALSMDFSFKDMVINVLHQLRTHHPDHFDKVIDSMDAAESIREQLGLMEEESKSNLMDESEYLPTELPLTPQKFTSNMSESQTTPKQNKKMETPKIPSVINLLSKMTGDTSLKGKTSFHLRSSFFYPNPQIKSNT